MPVSLHILTKIYSNFILCVPAYFKCMVKIGLVKFRVLEKAYCEEELLRKVEVNVGVWATNGDIIKEPVLDLELDLLKLGQKWQCGADNTEWCPNEATFNNTSIFDHFLFNYY